MRSLSATARAAINAQETDQVFLVLLTISHSDLAQPIRVVRDHNNITSRGDQYLAYPFDVTLPDDREDTITTVSLTIDNVDRSIATAIRTIAGAPDVTLEVVRADDPDEVEAGPFDFKLRDVTYNALTVSGELAFEDILNRAVVKNTFTPADFGGLSG